MTLTTDDLTILRKPFQPREHEFRQGFTYITEQAVTTRLEEVDPGWTLEIVSEYVRDAQCICLARMTVKGVSRDGVGMQAILEKGTAEPEKGAATDALKRCARLFGVGRYLLDAPANATIEILTQWLITNFAKPAPQVVEKKASEPSILKGDSEQRIVGRNPEQSQLNPFSVTSGKSKAASDYGN